MRLMKAKCGCGRVFEASWYYLDAIGPKCHECFEAERREKQKREEEDMQRQGYTFIVLVQLHHRAQQYTYVGHKDDSAEKQQRDAIAVAKRRFRKDHGLHPCSNPKGMKAEVKHGPILSGFHDISEASAHFAPQGGVVTAMRNDDHDGFVVRVPDQQAIHFYRVAHPTGPLEPFPFMYRSTGRYDEHSRYWNPALHAEKNTA